MEQDGLLEDRAAFEVATHLLLQHETLFLEGQVKSQREKDFSSDSVWVLKSTVRNLQKGGEIL